MEIEFRADLKVKKKFIVELKSLDIIPLLHFKRVITYFKLTKILVALMINFNKVLLKNGINEL